MTPNHTSASQILTFWFSELSPKQWWIKDAELDHAIRQRFHKLLQAARQNQCKPWRGSAEGRLAEIIVLDQFSRNIYRDQAEAFAADAQALTLAQQAVAADADQALTIDQRSFLYLPFMHSESAQAHEQAMRLFDQPGLEHNLEFERRHKEIIDRFGRYPHRNAILGRESTTEELAFLQQPGSSF